jgi:hypothetical protein
MAILVDRHFPVEGIDGWIDEAIAAFSARHLGRVLCRDESLNDLGLGLRMGA